MEATLLTAGVVCLIGAIVGGGLRAFGVEIPALKSIHRQVLLGTVGCAFIFSSLVIRSNDEKASPNSNTASNASAPSLNNASSVEQEDVHASPATVPFSRDFSLDEQMHRWGGGASPQAIAEAQRLLLDLGYDVGPPDAMPGPLTAAALRRFQNEYRLQETGIADENTLRVLRVRARLLRGRGN